jgi:hypothetical protein
MPRITIKDLPNDLRISREEMKKIAGGAVLGKARSKSESINSGLILIDMFAAAGDILSAYQDAVADEAYLSTATQRNSQVVRKRWRD